MSGSTREIRETVFWEDIGYFAEFLLENDSFRCKFRVVEIVGGSMANGQGPEEPCYPRAGAKMGHDTTADPSNAETYADGEAKWDGCSNWSFFTERCMKHWCSADGVASHGEMMNRVYAHCKATLVAGGGYTEFT